MRIYMTISYNFYVVAVTQWDKSIAIQADPVMAVSVLTRLETLASMVVGTPQILSANKTKKLTNLTNWIISQSNLEFNEVTI
jgi:hypothetical protein